MKLKQILIMALVTTMAITGLYAQSTFAKPLPPPGANPPVTTPPPANPPRQPGGPGGPGAGGANTVTCLDGQTVATPSGSDYAAVCKSKGHVGWKDNLKEADAKKACEQRSGKWTDHKCAEDKPDNSTGPGGGGGGSGGKSGNDTNTEVHCAVLPGDICKATNSKDLESNSIWKLLLLILQILTAGIGIVAVGAIAWAGFLYASANDDSSKTKEAKEMIRNTVIGIILYGLMYVGLQFLIPGGIFK